MTGKVNKNDGWQLAENKISSEKEKLQKKVYVKGDGSFISLTFFHLYLFTEVKAEVASL